MPTLACKNICWYILLLWASSGSHLLPTLVALIICSLLLGIPPTSILTDSNGTNMLLDSNGTNMLLENDHHVHTALTYVINSSIQRNGIHSTDITVCYVITTISKWIQSSVMLYAQPHWVGLITPLSRNKRHARVASVKISPVPRWFCQNSKPRRNKAWKFSKD